MSSSMYQIMNKIEDFIGNFGLKSPPGKWYKWLPKCAETNSNYEIEEGDVYKTLSETHMHNQSTSHGCYHFFQSDIKN